MPTVAYRARYVFPVDAPPLEDGCVAVEGERIVGVGRNLAADETHDFGDAAILPGLVNAHTHLEFSDLAQPLGRPGMLFPDWIREVIQFRRTAARASDAVRQGWQESLRQGVTTVGEIAQPGWREEDFAEAPIDSLVFQELLGLSPAAVPVKLAEAREHLGRADCRVGLAPHTPYTVHPELLRGAIELARQRQAPLAFHLAESPEELELLRTGRGPFRELFDELGFWVEGAIPRGARPLDYLRQLTAAPRTLIVHGNYLDQDEIDFVASHADRLAVIYCPRTHAYFGHAEHPWRRMLARGITVAIGTDSRASNPDLSVLAELRFLAHREVIDPASLLKMGTLAGAAALGLEQELGSLRPNKRANLTIVPLPPYNATDPHELLFDSQLQPTTTVWRGARL
jgi:cytosine/adenosine deaminase-related metal-dependent hydrolase